MSRKTVHFKQIKEAASWLIAELGPKMRIASPLGLGKPNLLINEIVSMVEKDPARSLKIYTALSLDPPHPKQDLELRFFGPFAERHWGPNYPSLAYLKPHPSIEVHEFYFQAGAALSSPSLQQHYQSINYTHVARRVFESDVQSIVQAIAKRETPEGVRYSLSCNPDLTLDVKDLYEEAQKPFHMIGVVHPDLPFLGGEAEVDESFFSAIVDDESNRHTLFALPRVPVDATDQAIGFYASQLVKDDGTLQVGIGSLSDAIVHSLLIREKQNQDYEALVAAAYADQPKPSTIEIHTHRFKVGLYGLSEMITDGFMHLRNAGILKREVRDELSGRSTYLHGAFFLGTKVFYEWLRKLSKADYDGLRMSRISKINDLYDPNEILLRKQRKNACFMNTCMQVTLLGSAASETLENGKVVSGVGGQYNFVSMSHELPDARSILMLRSTRTKDGKRSSNLVWTHGQLTIPRHLRDVIITEYGIAEVRNSTDSETIAALLNITDSEFQEELLAIAKQNLKIAADYEIPAWAKNNTPERVSALIQQGQQNGHFGAFPFGSDFTPEEEKLALALGKLAPLGTSGIAKELFHAGNSNDHSAELKRMGLDHPKSIKETIYRRLVQSTLARVDSEINLPKAKP